MRSSSRWLSLWAVGGEASSVSSAPLGPPRVLQGHAGHDACPCIDPWHLSSTTQLRTETCVLASVAGSPDPLCFSLDYGASRCRAWDAGLAPRCADAAGEPLEGAPSSCSVEWCFVNASDCRGDTPRPSVHFPDNAELRYSYTTCDSLDVFSMELLTLSLSGKTIRVGVPGSEPPFLEEWNADEAHGPEGFAVDLLEHVASVGSFQLEYHKPTADSLEAYPGSSYTACVRDVALERLDICIGNTWETIQRRSMVTFTPSYNIDLFTLIVFMEPGESIFQLVVKVFQPFSIVSWVVIGLSCLLVGNVMWMLGEVEGDHNMFTGSLQGMKRAFLKFLGQAGGFESTSSRPGAIIMFGFSFMCMIGSASYTANLSAFLLLNNMKTSIESIEDAIEQGARVCIHSALTGTLIGKHPDVEPLLVPVSSWEDYPRLMASGACSAFLGMETEWAMAMATHGAWGENGTGCDMTQVGNVVLTVNGGMPVRREFEQAIGFLMVQAKFQGVQDELRADNPLPDPVCEPPALLRTGAAALVPSDFTGILLLTGASIGLGVAVRFFELRSKDLQKKVSKTFSKQEQEDDQPSGDSQEMHAELRLQTRQQQEALDQLQQSVDRLLAWTADTATAAGGTGELLLALQQMAAPAGGGTTLAELNAEVAVEDEDERAGLGVRPPPSLNSAPGAAFSANRPR